MEYLASFDWSALLRQQVAVPAMVALVFIISIVVSAWVKIERAKIKSRLVERMVERGFSADEIERVLRNAPDRIVAKEKNPQ